MEEDAFASRPVTSFGDHMHGWRVFGGEINFGEESADLK
jgi:hypothetical protein